MAARLPDILGGSSNEASPLSRVPLLLGLANFAAAEQGNPKIKTIEAIAFGPKGLLLIGGGRPQVVSVETGDTTMVPWSTEASPTSIRSSPASSASRRRTSRSASSPSIRRRARPTSRSNRSRRKPASSSPSTGPARSRNSRSRTSSSRRTPSPCRRGSGHQGHGHRLGRRQDRRRHAGLRQVQARASSRSTRPRTTGPPRRSARRPTTPAITSWETQAPLAGPDAVHRERQDQRGRLVHLHADRAVLDR